jgi:hypothetical protein
VEVSTGVPRYSNLGLGKSIGRGLGRAITNVFVFRFFLGFRAEVRDITPFREDLSSD